VRAYTSARPEGAPTDPNPLAGVTFQLDDVVFRCDGEPDLLDQSELALLAAQATDARSPEAQAAVAAFLQMALGEAQYRQFRMHTKGHHTPADVIMDIIAGINEELEDWMAGATSRPTGQPSRSSPGGSAQDDRVSKVISLGRGTVDLVAPAPEGTPQPKLPQDHKAPGGGQRAKRQSGGAKASSSRAG